MVIPFGDDSHGSFDLATEMRKRNRTANIFWFDNCGHVPPLMAPEQIDVVSRFLA